MKPLVECVVNVSEGRRIEVIDAIQKCIEINSTRLLHKDVGYDANRTVFTLVGSLEDLFQSIRHLFEFAIDHLDIKVHGGAHPRIGIIDVIPFIPIRDISMRELIIAVSDFAEDLYQEFKVPLFFYGNLQKSYDGRSLNYFRKGGLSQLQNRLQNNLKPDVGQAVLHPQLGASCVTCRDYMVAFNVNLKTKNLDIAKEIARHLIKIRNSKKDPTLKDVKFLAWHMPQFDCCQISTNLYDIHTIDLRTLFKKIKKVAVTFGISLNGSELIGLVPRKAIAHDVNDLHEALLELAFNSVVPFNIENRILELAIEKNGFTLRAE